jgi:hypothetical protein
MIELHNEEYIQGKHDFTLAMNAFGDMVVWCASLNLCFLSSTLSKIASCFNVPCTLFEDE